MKYIVKSLDVWGHAPSKCCAGYGCDGHCVTVAEDGTETHDDDACMCTFEINDMFRAGSIEVPNTASDELILAILDNEGFIHAEKCEVDDYSDGTTLGIVAKDTHRPLLTLDAEEES